MTDARKAKAPCGHDGEHVIGTYVRCLTPGCDGLPKSDGVPEHVDPDPERTKPLCKDCGSSSVRPYPGMIQAGQQLWFCDSCHRSFLA